VGSNYPSRISAGVGIFAIPKTDTVKLGRIQPHYGQDDMAEYDQIWVRADLANFWSRSTWLDLAEFRPGLFRLIQPNFGQSWLSQIWPHLGQGLLDQISVRVYTTVYVGRGRLNWIQPNFGHDRLS